MGGRTALQTYLLNNVECLNPREHGPIDNKMQVGVVLLDPCNFGDLDVQCHSVDVLEDGQNLQECELN